MFSFFKGKSSSGNAQTGNNNKQSTNDTGPPKDKELYVQVFNSEGDTVFVSLKTGKASWNLPPYVTYKEVKYFAHINDDDGRCYYENMEKGGVTWSLPTDDPVITPAAVAAVQNIDGLNREETEKLIGIPFSEATHTRINDEIDQFFEDIDQQKGEAEQKEIDQEKDDEESEEESRPTLARPERQDGTRTDLPTSSTNDPTHFIEEYYIQTFNQDGDPVFVGLQSGQGYWILPRDSLLPKVKLFSHINEEDGRLYFEDIDTNISSWTLNVDDSVVFQAGYDTVMLIDSLTRDQCEDFIGGPYDEAAIQEQNERLDNYLEEKEERKQIQATMATVPVVTPTEPIKSTSVATPAAPEKPIEPAITPTKTSLFSSFSSMISGNKTTSNSNTGISNNSASKAEVKESQPPQQPDPLLFYEKKITYLEDEEYLQTFNADGDPVFIGLTSGLVYWLPAAPELTLEKVLIFSHVNESDGRLYYEDPVTGKVTWQLPEDTRIISKVAQEMIERIDQASRTETEVIIGQRYDAKGTDRLTDQIDEFLARKDIERQMALHPPPTTATSGTNAKEMKKEAAMTSVAPTLQSSQPQKEKLIQSINREGDTLLIGLLSGQLFWNVPSNNQIESVIYLTHQDDEENITYEDIMTGSVLRDPPLVKDGVISSKGREMVIRATIMSRKECEEVIGSRYDEDITEQLNEALGTYLDHLDEIKKNPPLPTPVVVTTKTATISSSTSNSTAQETKEAANTPVVTPAHSSQPQKEKLIQSINREGDTLLIGLLSGQLFWNVPSNNQIESVIYLTHQDDEENITYEDIMTGAVLGDPPLVKDGVISSKGREMVIRATTMSRKECEKVIGSRYDEDTTEQLNDALGEYLDHLDKVKKNLPAVPTPAVESREVKPVTKVVETPAVVAPVKEEPKITKEEPVVVQRKPSHRRSSFNQFNHGKETALKQLPEIKSIASIFANPLPALSESEDEKEEQGPIKVTTAVPFAISPPPPPSHPIATMKEDKVAKEPVPKEVAPIHTPMNTSSKVSEPDSTNPAKVRFAEEVVQVPITPRKESPVIVFPTSASPASSPSPTSMISGGGPILEKYMQCFNVEGDTVLIGLQTGKLYWDLPADGTWEDIIYLTHLHEDGRIFFEEIASGQLLWSAPPAKPGFISKQAHRMMDIVEPMTREETELIVESPFDEQRTSKFNQALEAYLDRLDEQKKQQKGSLQKGNSGSISGLTTSQPSLTESNLQQFSQQPPLIRQTSGSQVTKVTIGDKEEELPIVMKASPTSPLKPTVMLTGYLKKLATQSGRNWKKRFIVLTAFTISYYENEKQANITNHIATGKSKGDVAIMADADIQLYPTGEGLGFKFFNKKEGITFAATNDAERKRWMDKIREMIILNKRFLKSTSFALLTKLPNASPEKILQLPLKVLKTYAKRQFLLLSKNYLYFVKDENNLTVFEDVLQFQKLNIIFTIIEKPSSGGYFFFFEIQNPQLSASGASQYILWFQAGESGERSQKVIQEYNLWKDAIEKQTQPAILLVEQVDLSATDESPDNTTGGGLASARPSLATLFKIPSIFRLSTTSLPTEDITTATGGSEATRRNTRRSSLTRASMRTSVTREAQARGSVTSSGSNPNESSRLSITTGSHVSELSVLRDSAKQDSGDALLKAAMRKQDRLKSVKAGKSFLLLDEQRPTRQDHYHWDEDEIPVEPTTTSMEVQLSTASSEAVTTDHQLAVENEEVTTATRRKSRRESFSSNARKNSLAGNMPGKEEQAKNTATKQLPTSTHSGFNMGVTVQRPSSIILPPPPPPMIPTEEVKSEQQTTEKKGATEMKTETKPAPPPAKKILKISDLKKQAQEKIATESEVKPVTPTAVKPPPPPPPPPPPRRPSVFPAVHTISEASNNTNVMNIKTDTVLVPVKSSPPSSPPVLSPRSSLDSTSTAAKNAVEMAAVQKSEQVVSPISTSSWMSSVFEPLSEPGISTIEAESKIEPNKEDPLVPTSAEKARSRSTRRQSVKPPEVEEETLPIAAVLKSAIPFSNASTHNVESTPPATPERVKPPVEVPAVASPTAKKVSIQVAEERNNDDDDTLSQTSRRSSLSITSPRNALEMAALRKAQRSGSVYSTDSSVTMTSQSVINNEANTNKSNMTAIFGSVEGEVKPQRASFTKLAAPSPKGGIFSRPQQPSKRRQSVLRPFEDLTIEEPDTPEAAGLPKLNALEAAKLRKKLKSTPGVKSIQDSSVIRPDRPQTHSHQAEPEVHDPKISSMLQDYHGYNRSNLVALSEYLEQSEEAEVESKEEKKSGPPAVTQNTMNAIRRQSELKEKRRQSLHRKEQKQTEMTVDDDEEDKYTNINNSKTALPSAAVPATATSMRSIFGSVDSPPRSDEEKENDDKPATTATVTTGSAIRQAALKKLAKRPSVAIRKQQTETSKPSNSVTFHLPEEESKDNSPGLIRLSLDEEENVEGFISRSRGNSSEPDEAIIDQPILLRSSFARNSLNVPLESPLASSSSSNLLTRTFTTPIAATSSYNNYSEEGGGSGGYVNAVDLFKMNQNKPLVKIVFENYAYQKVMDITSFQQFTYDFGLYMTDEELRQIIFDYSHNNKKSADHLFLSYEDFLIFWRSHPLFSTMKMNDKATKRRLFIAYLFRQQDNLSRGFVKTTDFPKIYQRLVDTHHLHPKRHKINDILTVIDPYHKGKIEMNRFIDWMEMNVKAGSSGKSTLSKIWTSISSFASSSSQKEERDESPSLLGDLSSTKTGNNSRSTTPTSVPSSSIGLFTGSKNPRFDPYQDELWNPATTTAAPAVSSPRSESTEEIEEIEIDLTGFSSPSPPLEEVAKDSQNRPMTITSSKPPPPPPSTASVPATTKPSQTETIDLSSLTFTKPKVTESRSELSVLPAMEQKEDSTINHSNQATTSNMSSSKKKSMFTRRMSVMKSGPSSKSNTISSSTSRAKTDLASPPPPPPPAAKATTATTGEMKEERGLSASVPISFSTFSESSAGNNSGSGNVMNPLLALKRKSVGGAGSDLVNNTSSIPTAKMEEKQQYEDPVTSRTLNPLMRQKNIEEALPVKTGAPPPPPPPPPPPSASMKKDQNETKPRLSITTSFTEDGSSRQPPQESQQSNKKIQESEEDSNSFRRGRVKRVEFYNAPETNLRNTDMMLHKSLSVSSVTSPPPPPPPPLSPSPTSYFQQPLSETTSSFFASSKNLFGSNCSGNNNSLPAAAVSPPKSSRKEDQVSYIKREESRELLLSTKSDFFRQIQEKRALFYQLLQVNESEVRQTLSDPSQQQRLQPSSLMVMKNPLESLTKEERESLRLFIEQAMPDATKTTRSEFSRKKQSGHPSIPLDNLFDLESDDESDFEKNDDTDREEEEDGEGLPQTALSPAVKKASTHETIMSQSSQANQPPPTPASAYQQLLQEKQKLLQSINYLHDFYYASQERVALSQVLSLQRIIKAAEDQLNLYKSQREYIASLYQLYQEEIIQKTNQNFAHQQQQILQYTTTLNQLFYQKQYQIYSLAQLLQKKYEELANYTSFYQYLQQKNSINLQDLAELTETGIDNNSEQVTDGPLVVSSDLSLPRPVDELRYSAAIQHHREHRGLKKLETTQQVKRELTEKRQRWLRQKQQQQERNNHQNNNNSNSNNNDEDDYDSQAGGKYGGRSDSSLDDYNSDYSTKEKRQKKSRKPQHTTTTIMRASSQSPVYDGYFESEEEEGEQDRIVSENPHLLDLYNSD